MNDRVVSQLGRQRQRIAAAQEQVASGKRINRPSDDPYGAAAVIQIRSSQAVLEQFSRNARAADTALTVADGALDSYEQMLDRASSLLAQGVSDITTPEARRAIANEIDGLRLRALNVANLQSDGHYVFGGTRQDVPPVDPVTVTLAVSSTSPRVIQVEQDAPPITAGVTADFVFSNSDGTIFNTLAAVAAALRGTVDPVADQAAMQTGLEQLEAFGEQARTARTTLGKSFNMVEDATARIEQASLALESNAQEVESADFARAATDLVEAERALEAILESEAHRGRRTLLDIIG
jgi:flagellar hook-associated protein 3 FlgL